jgi:hypothetical protein
MKGTVFNPEIETAVLKEAAQYEPVAAHQVVHAIADYMEHLEFDDNDRLIKGSAKKLVKALVQKEPNLFKNTEVSSEESAGFSGKSPGGSLGGVPSLSPAEKKKKEALALLGITK